jgi:homoserine dehydrogenase
VTCPPTPAGVSQLFRVAWARPVLLCRSGKHVCTANKAMLAKNLAEIIELCKAPGAGKLTFEPAVAGGRP